MSLEAPRPVQRVLTPLREFLDSNVSGGILLLGAAIVALVWSNSPFAESYDSLWETQFTIGFGEAGLSLSLHEWINDGLMALFFLVVGLEIKREILVGELASARRAMLPAAAAVGGAVLPAAIFLAIVGPGSPDARGWAVPMATDIAFALGVLALLGRRVPLGLRIFVTALAIVDDLLAVLVIALFYTADLALPALGAAGLILLLLVAANVYGIRWPLVYAILGLGLWLAVHESGIHATVAGVLLAMTIPARERIPDVHFAGRAREIIDDYEGSSAKVLHHRQARLWELEELTQNAQAPMLRLEHALNPWVAFAIVPLFALANAGVHLGGDIAAMLADPVVLGISAGLILGKQLGITAAAWLIVRSGLAALPAGVTWTQIYGAAWVCGIGFTMSLFIAALAYGTSETLALAKVGILLASIAAGGVGYVLLRLFSRRRDSGDDESEEFDEDVPDGEPALAPIR
ncbi:Na+/H+ antiporter NhaA [soil metagenome]